MKVGRRTVLVGVASLISAGASAQERKKIVVGLLSWWPPSLEAAHVAYLRDGLKAYGYVEGRNLEIIAAFVGGDVARARDAARGFVERGVDVIVAAATPAVTIAKQATEARRIPIVMAPVSDPLATGLVQSIARPGGHLTGMAMIGPDLTGKRLELLREIVPGLKSIAFIGWTRDQNAKTFLGRIQAAATQLDLRLVEKMVDAASDIDEALMRALKADGVDAVVIQPIFMGHHDRIIAVARAAKLPVLSDFPVFAEAGALMTYGIDDRAQMRRAAYFIDRIVKGTSPADLPIELPTEVTFIVNLKTAKEFGLTVPPAVLQRATEVVE
jgi:putative ABC transport system substrate-binding protein